MHSASTTRILVLRGGAIGDFILTAPVLDALRTQWPDARLTLVAQPRLCRLAMACGLADVGVALDVPVVSRLYVRDAWATTDPGPLRDHDATVCLFRDPDGTVRANLAAARNGRLAYLDPVAVAGHAADYLGGVLAPLDVAPRSPCIPRLRLLPSAPAPRFVPTLPGPVVLLHPGSGSPRKNWPAERFAALGLRLAAETPATPVFVLGEADAAAAATVKRVAPGIACLPPCDLDQLAAEVATANAYVGNDAGITHLAAALGVRTVALFGPSDPAVWAPRGLHVRIIRTADADIAHIPLSWVLDASAAALQDCGSC